MALVLKILADGDSVYDYSYDDVDIWNYAHRI